ncbi:MULTISPECIES: hypothetical protein [Kocuria]|uniref:Uncharacterized protein n=1 Tax=Kocuria subflava TaxID=1736139 RepID=A0A846U1K9_9MICC|nr:MULTISPECIES: hypothetical protein [Kocuria]NKE08611.1 hypothetical protein [Kocuria subflava]
MVLASHPADPNPQPPATQQSHQHGEQQQQYTEVMSYRRAPKLPVFLILGGALGAVVGMLVGVLGSGNAMFTTGQVVGYMIAIFTLLGFSVGAVVALILDRVSLKRAQEVQTRVEAHASERVVRRTAEHAPGNNRHAQVPDSESGVKE